MLGEKTLFCWRRGGDSPFYKDEHCISLQTYRGRREEGGVAEWWWEEWPLVWMQEVETFYAQQWRGFVYKQSNDLETLPWKTTGILQCIFTIGNTIKILQQYAWGTDVTVHHCHRRWMPQTFKCVWILLWSSQKHKSLMIMPSHSSLVELLHNLFMCPLATAEVCWESLLWWFTNECDVSLFPCIIHYRTGLFFLKQNKVSTPSPDSVDTLQHRWRLSEGKVDSECPGCLSLQIRV